MEKINSNIIETGISVADTWNNSFWDSDFCTEYIKNLFVGSIYPVCIWTSQQTIYYNSWRTLYLTWFLWQHTFFCFREWNCSLIPKSSSSIRIFFLQLAFIRIVLWMCGFLVLLISFIVWVRRYLLLFFVLSIYSCMPLGNNKKAACCLFSLSENFW